MIIWKLKKYSFLKFISCLCTFSYCGFTSVFAENPNIIFGRESKQPIPRFVTLSDKITNLRNGPSREQPILWIYQYKGIPVEIIDEYEDWRKIRDLDGSEGWVWKNLLSGKRNVITLEGTHNIYKKPDTNSAIQAKIDGSVIAEPSKCDYSFCYIIHDKFEGWIARENIYGIYDHEKF